MSDSRRGQRRRGRRRDRRPADGSPPGRSRSPRAPRPARTNGARRIAELCELAPFPVFCALHLGITEFDGFEIQDPAQVASRFDLSEEELRDYLDSHQLTPEHLTAAGFDVEGALYDIEVAPDGISRLELARTLYEELSR